VGTGCITPRGLVFKTVLKNEKNIFPRGGMELVQNVEREKHRCRGDGTEREGFN